MILQCSWFCAQVEVIELPLFEANEFLYSTHADKGIERWEIQAWALRQIMLEAGNLQACDMDFYDKKQYERFMQMKKDAWSPYIEKEAAPEQELVEIQQSDDGPEVVP